jgi:hypothetical protein
MVMSVNRSTAQVTLQQAAERMALAGINEGYLRYIKHSSTNPILNEYGEYGNQITDSASVSGTQYKLVALRRGFTDDACTSLSQDVITSSTAYKKSCPYYDLVIRKYVSLVDNTALKLSRRDMPQDDVIYSFTVSHKVGGEVDGRGIIVTNLNANNSPIEARYQPNVITARCADSGWRSVARGSNVTLVVNNCNGNLHIRVQNFVSSGASQVTVKRTASSGYGLLIDKKYVTIEATGFAGNMKRSKILTFRPMDATLNPPGPSWELSDAPELMNERGSYKL